MKAIIVAVMVTMLSFIQPIPTEQMIVVAEIERIAEEYPDWSSEYTIGVFDCSEMSAYVSYRLDEIGIENRIVVGERRGFRHAWVETKDTVIECTSLTVYADKTYYFQGQPRWEPSQYRVYEKTTFNGSEWDWWDSPIFKGVTD